MEYTIVFIKYNSYCAFYECNNRNITYDTFNAYAKLKEELVTDEYKPYTRLTKLPNSFPDMFSRTYYHAKIVQSVLLLLNARSEKQYKPYYIHLVYKNEFWCFKKDTFFKPLFFDQTQERDNFQNKIKEFVEFGFPLTEKDIYRHPYKEFKRLQLPNSFYFTKGIYIKKPFFDYIIDLLNTSSDIFEMNHYEYDDDEHAMLVSSSQAYEFTSEIEEVEGEDKTVLEEQKKEEEEVVAKTAEEVMTKEVQENKNTTTYVDSKIARPMYALKGKEDTRMVL